MKSAVLFACSAFALMAGLSPSVLLAQVYKCGKDGQVVFSDKPCPEVSAGPYKPANPVTPQGQLDFQVGTQHYTVNGANLLAAYASMRANGPGGFAGYARWNVAYQYESKANAQGCMISSLNVKVKSSILMPNWIEEKNATPADQAAWRTLYGNLKRHEDGHIQHGREFGLLLKERLLGMGTVPCAELQIRAQTEYQRLAENLRRRDEEYDRRTEHGLRQDNPR